MRKIFYLAKLAIMLAKFAFRFLAGQPLLGGRKTDATFLRPATRSLDPSHTALRWEMMRGAARSAWRLGGVYLLFLLSLSVFLFLLGRIPSVPPLPLLLRPAFLLSFHLLSALLLLAGWRIRRRCLDHGYWYPLLVREDFLLLVEEEGGRLPKKRKKIRLRWEKVEGRKAWREEKILPLARSASIILSTHIPEREAEKWVTVPKDYRESGGSSVILMLPSSFPGDQGVQKRLLSAVNQKLGMRDTVANWQLEGSSPRVLVSSPPEPPTLIRFEEVKHFLEAMGEWDFFYGVIGTKEAFSVSISGDAPHGAVSAGSGAGKSELLKGKVMQAGHKGWFTIILDWKEESQNWAKGQDGIRYVSKIEKIHDMCVALGDEVEWRKAHFGQGRPNVLILAEEWSITAPLLSDYWSALRSMSDPEERRTMPLRSPAITSLMKVVFTGRALGLFIELVAIRFSTRVTNGNADLRESFQVIHMARYKSQTVKMLAPDIKPFPKKPKDPGRWIAVDGDRAVIYQAPLYTDQEAIEWHQSGIPVPSSPWSERYEGVSGACFAQQVDMAPTQGFVLGDRLAAPNQTLPILEGEIVKIIDARKLTDMINGLAHLGITANILRHAAKDSGKEFPAVIGGSPNKGYTYDFEEVKEWAKRRHATLKVERSKG